MYKNIRYNRKKNFGDLFPNIYDYSITNMLLISKKFEKSLEKV